MFTKKEEKKEKKKSLFIAPKPRYGGDKKTHSFFCSHPSKKILFQDKKTVVVCRDCGHQNILRTH